MPFKRDLFISYAHIDNVPLAATQQGWVTRFHSALEALLSMRLGAKARVWRDQKLTGSDIFSDEILAQFESTAVLLSVLSPRYVESDWCRREVEAFCKAAAHEGLAVQNKSRVMKVLKSPPMEKETLLPEVMRTILGHQFYDLDEDDAPLELDPMYGEAMAQRYNVRVAKLAWDIASVVRLLRASEEAGKPVEAVAAASDKPTVYLAECSRKQRDQREALDAELRCSGYRVLPDRQLPQDETEFVSEVARMLEQCKLSVHLVGSGLGAVLDGESQKSIVVLQNELATQASHRNGLRRIIWLPEGTKGRHPDQEKFIQAIQTDAEAQFGADVITSPQQEVMKGAIHEALDKLENQAAKPAARSEHADGKLIYLICDARDRKKTIPLRKLLGQKGFEVEIPLFEGDAATVRQANQSLLEQCSGALIFYGEAGEAWKRSVTGEIRKFLGARQDKRKIPVFTYLEGPDSEAKQELVELETPDLLNGLAGLTQDALDPFVAVLESAGR